MVDIKQYEVAIGFNVRVGNKKPTKFKPATLIKANDGYELRYDVGLVIELSDLPAVANVEWLTGERGCLVPWIEVQDESPSEPEDISVAPEEVDDGEA